MAHMSVDEFRSIKDRLGMTAAEMAVALGLHERTVRKYLSGEQSISQPIQKLLGFLVREAENKARRQAQRIVGH